MSEQYVVSVGPVKEPFHYGPFNSSEEAKVWIKKEQEPEGVIGYQAARTSVLNLP